MRLCGAKCTDLGFFSKSNINLSIFAAKILNIFRFYPLKCDNLMLFFDMTL